MEDLLSKYPTNFGGQFIIPKCAEAFVISQRLLIVSVITLKQVLDAMRNILNHITQLEVVFVF